MAARCFSKNAMEFIQCPWAQALPLQAQGLLLRAQLQPRVLAVVESAEAKAERMVLEELKKLGWRREELGKRRKGDAEKVRIALRLRKETTMTSAWIAQRLEMGTKTHLSHLLYWQGRGKK